MTEFSNSYLLAQLQYLNDEFSRLPNVKLSMHRKVEVACIPANKSNPKKREHRTTTTKGQQFKNIAILRSSLKRKIKKLSSQYGISVDNVKISIREDKIFPISIKSSLKPDSNPHPKSGNYWHNGIQMRSRLEVITAQVLDSLELEYMYEVELFIGDVIYYPDFVVFLPELGCCFVIECLGMCDDTSYMYRNNERFGLYFNAGFYPNQNLLFFCGTKDSIPTTQSMKSDIIHLINNLTDKLVTVE